MGIRVNKAIGYGVRNLKPDDPRVDWDKLHHPDHCESRWDKDMKNFRRCLQKEQVQKRLLELHMREYPALDDGMRRFIETDIKFLVGYIQTQMKNNPTAWMYYRGPSGCLIHDDEGGRGGVMLFLSPDCPDWLC